MREEFNRNVLPLNLGLKINLAVLSRNHKSLKKGIQDYIDNLEYMYPPEQHEEVKHQLREYYRHSTGKIFVEDRDAELHLITSF